MSLQPGTRLGPYEIVAPIGAGGMGEVYRATDTHLKRSVAIKVLPASVAGDADRLARFQREAEVLAALNHPNIAAIYGLEKTSDLTALVMELVEGEDLSALIHRGDFGAAHATPYADILSIAKQIAEALEAAHELGIIHRDLKPANIKIRTDGTVKVLDFGLAKALDSGTQHSAPSTQHGSMAPTMTSPAMTAMGMILGTAAYMAPEQAKGRPVDKRADIWAFGVVLHEMLTGRRLFEAEDVSETLAAVLTRDVSLTSLPPAVPARLRALVRDCLIRDPKQRLRDIGDARLVLDKLIAGAPDDVTAPAAASASIALSSRTRELIFWTALVVTAALVTALTWKWLGGATPDPVASRFELTLPAKTSPLGWPEISPDGRHMAAVVVGDDGIARIWIRPIGAVAFQVLAGTEGASYPFWSPESRSLAFFANDTLKKIAIAGGPPQPVCAAPRARGGTWSRAGVMLFSARFADVEQLHQVAEGGGTTAALMPIQHPKRALQRWPHFLPDGRHFLFFWSVREAETDGVYVTALGETGATRLVAGFTEARYSDGFLFFVRDFTLLAQPFDASRRVLGPTDPVPVVASIRGGGNEGSQAFSVSERGVLVAVPLTADAKNQMKWFDRSGRWTGNLGVPANLRAPRISDDGLRVATYADAQGTSPTGGSIWLTEAKSGRTRRLTFSDGGYLNPIWVPRTSDVFFGKATRATGISDLFRQSTNGTASQEPLLVERVQKVPQDVSLDGRYLLYTALPTQSTNDLWIVSIADRKSSLYVKNALSARVSPDGRWVAYAGTELGPSEIYLQSFPAPGTKFPISNGGGSAPVWSRRGGELFYVAGGKVMAVSVSTAGETPKIGQATPVFDLPGLADYDVSLDGRFLFAVPVENQTPTALVTLNWKSGLRK